MECRLHFESLSALLDGELAGQDRERAESHLRACSSCAQEWRSLKRAHQVVDRALESLPLRRSLWSEVEAEIKGDLTASPPTLEERRKPVSSPGFRPWRWAFPTAAGLVALLWFAFPTQVEEVPTQLAGAFPATVIEEFEEFIKSREAQEVEDRQRRQRGRDAGADSLPDVEANPYRLVSRVSSGNPFASE